MDNLRGILINCLAVSEATNDASVKELAVDVYDIVLKEIENKKQNNPNALQSKKQMNKIQKKLKVLMYQYENSLKERKKFFKNFDIWKNIRKRNIDALIKIAEWINYHRQNCNISKLVGSSVGIIGGIMCVVSSALIPFTFGATTALAIAGASMGGAGAATSFGAAVAEVSLESKNINEANILIEKDKTEMQETLSWYKQSEELKKAMDDIIGFDMMNELIKQATEFVNQFKKVSDAIASDKFLSLVKNMINIMSKVTVCPIVGFIPLIISIVIVTIYLDKKNRFMIDTIFFMKRSAVLISIALDLFTDGAVCILQGVKGVSPVVLRAAARGALAGVGLVVDVASLVLTSIDVHEGSVSENAKNIMKLADTMEKELKYFQTTYDELSKKKGKR